MARLKPHGASKVSLLITAAFFGGTVLSADIVGAQSSPVGGGKPNIVFMLMDNLGYGEVGAYGGGITRGAPTPRIDRLATEATRLTNFNVEAQCTPSRSAFMTGRFSIRSGTHSVPIGGGLEGLTQWEVTIAETLSAAGYATAAFGKWHLGSDQGRLPNDQGFDEWYGIPRTTDEAFWPSQPAAKAAGVAFTHIMEGRKGEKQPRTRRLRSRPAPADRCRDHAPDRGFHDAQRRLGQAVLRLCPVHSSPLPDAAASEVRRPDRFRGLPRRACRNGRPRGRDPRRHRRPAHPRQHDRGVHQRQRSGSELALAGIVRARGGATTSRTWKARCGCRSSSAGRAAFPQVASATRSCIRSISTRRSPGSQALRCRKTARSTAWTRADFLLGKSDTSNRDGFPVFVADRLEAVKWRNWKIAFYDEQRDWWSPPVKLGIPKAFDLITDPKEEYPATGLRNTWNAAPAIKIVTEFEQSLKKYPPIAPGTPDPYTPPK